MELINSHLSPEELSEHDQKMAEIIPDENGQINRSSITRLTESIRKPETRTPWSTFYAETMKQYLNAAYDQQDLPDALKKFRQLSGVVSPWGSVLHGTSHAASDVDVKLFYDSSLDDDFENPDRDLEAVIDGQTHPGKLRLDDFIDRELATNPKWEQWKKNREEQKRQIASEQDLSTTDVYKLAKVISEGNDPTPEDCNAVAELLTTPGNLAFETTDNSLLHLQQLVVRSIYGLSLKDQQRAIELMDLFNKYLKQAISYSSKKYPDWDNQLLKQYVQTNSQIPANKIEKAVSMLKTIRANQSLPPIQELAKDFGIIE